MSSQSVTRYVVTHIGRKSAFRTLIGPAQGRFTFATHEDAAQHLHNIMANNSEERLGEVYGLPLEVRPVECWPGHFDPKTVWFD